MIVFFGIVFVLGLLLVLLDVAAKMSDPVPSMYRYDIAETGVLMMGAGLVGGLCVYVFG